MGSNQIVLGSGSEAVIGGDGEATFSAGALSALKSIDPTYAGIDMITGPNGTGGSTIIGGSGSNTIDIGGANNTIIGADGEALFSNGHIQIAESLYPANAGANSITVDDGGNPNGGHNLIMGGSGSNTINIGTPSNATSGADTVIGANGEAIFTSGVLTTIESISPTYAGTNKITVTGAGNAVIGNVVIGGSGSNTISVGGSNNTIVGANGEVTFSSSGVLQNVLSLDPANAGGNTITTSGSGNLIIGGSGPNTITAGSSTASANVVIGANGQATFSGGKLATVASTSPTYAAKNTIKVTGANNVVIGGSGSNVILLVGSNSTIIGANGQASFTSSGSVASASVTNAAYFGNNQITVSGGSGNTIYPGGGSNTLNVPSGNVIVGGSDDETEDLTDLASASPSDEAAAVAGAFDDEAASPDSLDRIIAYSLGEIAASWRTLMDQAFASDNASVTAVSAEKPVSATDLIIRAIRDSEIVVKVGSAVEAAGAVWLFDDRGGARSPRSGTADHRDRRGA